MGEVSAPGVILAVDFFDPGDLCAVETDVDFHSVVRQYDPLDRRRTVRRVIVTSPMDADFISNVVTTRSPVSTTSLASWR